MGLKWWLTTTAWLAVYIAAAVLPPLVFGQDDKVIGWCVAAALVLCALVLRLVLRRGRTS